MVKINDTISHHDYVVLHMKNLTGAVFHIVNEHEHICLTLGYCRYAHKFFSVSSTATVFLTVKRLMAEPRLVAFLPVAERSGL